jgi:hypothetical protein
MHCRPGATTEALHAAVYLPEATGQGGEDGEEHAEVNTWRALLLVVIFFHQRLTGSPYAATQNEAALALLRDSLNFRSAAAAQSPPAPAGFQFSLGGGLLCPLLTLLLASDLANTSLQGSFFSYGTRASHPRGTRLLPPSPR